MNATFAMPAAVLDQLNGQAPEVREARSTEYSVQVVRSFFEAKKGKRITHARAVASAGDTTRDPGTFCGKAWRHPDVGYLFFDVVANVERREAIDRVSCVACLAVLTR